MKSVFRITLRPYPGGTSNIFAEEERLNHSKFLRTFAQTIAISLPSFSVGKTIFIKNKGYY